VEDVQGRTDAREIPIDQVGVSDLRYPITVLDRENGVQHTVARLSLSVSLPHHFKGTHMSRFVEILNRHRGEVTLRTLPIILEELRERLDAEHAHVEALFPYFVERAAPVTGAKALVDYDCAFVGVSGPAGTDLQLRVTVPVTSLCPCSKEISDYGAHNQRGHVTIAIRTTPGADSGGRRIVWIEELVAIADASASAPVYALLKRPDERHVTMQAYDSPAFVEDIVRGAAVRLKADDRIAWFEVTAVNQESIHNHNAFARVVWARSERRADGQ
jgi:GTP cyclohydrolase I